MRSLLFGTVLGMTSSAVGIGGLYALFITYGLIASAIRARWWFDSVSLSILATDVSFAVLAYVYFTIGPSTIAGGVIGLSFYLVARPRLSVRIAAGIGVLVGLIEGGVAAWIIAPIPDPQGWFPDLPRGLLWNGGIGIIQGLFVSMILYIWFKRKMR